MKPNDQDSLLAEILSGAELENLRHTSMARSLAAMKTKRRKRMAGRIALGIIIPALFAFTFMRRSSESKSPIVARHQIEQVPHQTAQAAPQAEAIKTIGDDELLALFTDRGVALIGKPGNQRLMVFDKQSL